MIQLVPVGIENYFAGMFLTAISFICISSKTAYKTAVIDHQSNQELAQNLPSDDQIVSTSSDVADQRTSHSLRASWMRPIRSWLYFGRYQSIGLPRLQTISTARLHRR